MNEGRKDLEKDLEKFLELEALEKVSGV